MTQEEKELLLKDLCARLPYGVYVNMLSFSKKEQVKLESISLSDDTYLIINDTWYLTDEYPKPYLRPMSSMTEVEKHIFDTMTRGYTVQQQASLFDWLNAHHFDYRGLIEKSLAIKAPKDIYN